MSEPTATPSLSSVMFAAVIAVEKELPPYAASLVKDHDALHGEWRALGYPMPRPEHLADRMEKARRAVEQDPYASYAMGLRRQANQQWIKEREPKHG